MLKCHNLEEMQSLWGKGRSMLEINNIIYTSSMDQIKKQNGPHLAPGPRLTYTILTVTEDISAEFNFTQVSQII